jgi:hypothetical protein
MTNDRRMASEKWAESGLRMVPGALRVGVLRVGLCLSFALPLSAALAVAATTTGCVSGSKGLSAEDKERLKQYELDTPPTAIAQKIDVNFENKLRLIGYAVEPEVAPPGTPVKITFYWRAEDAVEDGWMLFTHLRDSVADRSDNLDWKGPLREQRGRGQIFPPSKWQKGKIYVDEQNYVVPDWVQGPEIDVFTGIWKNDARFRILSGPNDGDNRALVAKIKTGLTPKPAHTNLPTMTANKLAANEKIVIDGKADDAAWKEAASTGPFVDVGTGKPDSSFPVQGSAKLAWDDKNLYVLFEVTDPDVVGGFTTPDKQPNEFTVQKQPKLWTKDTVEIMVDPDGDGDNQDYYEIQINPQNKTFTTQYDGYNVPKSDPNGPYGHEDWDPKMKSAVVVRGTIDKSGDKDEGYVVEAAIPWAAFSKAKTSPPANGDTWRMNFYAMQNNGGTAWSPILGQGNFHKASRFGKVTWRDPSAPEPEAAAAAPDPNAPANRGIPNMMPPRGIERAMQMQNR